jgi:pyrimidine-nucleoside phosphorylase
MRVLEILAKKRDGMELHTDEIRSFVQGLVSGQIPDYQVAAWLMAVYFSGMSSTETSALTAAMVESGDRIDLSDIPGIKVDKHSTGGVGDKTTLVLAPLVAAAGVPIAKISGRALGHTGGTLDKLESFPGFEAELSPESFISQVNRIGLAIAGQTANLVPADKLLYALRDVTATVNSVPLIAASIMSKKLAAGADALVLDVKTGSGAFMPELNRAQELARVMVDIARNHGRKAVAVITDMSQPLGRGVGNVLEVREAIAALRGQGPEDLSELCLVLGAEMLVLAGKADYRVDARKTLEEIMASGAALHKLAQMVEAQGGDASFVYDDSRFPLAPVRLKVVLSKAGYISAIDTKEIGLTAMQLGAGRQTKTDRIHHSVGLEVLCKVGSRVLSDETVAIVHARSVPEASEAVQRLKGAFQVSELPTAPLSLVLDRLAAT